MEAKACPKCGSEIDAAAAANNGKKYCSVSCRRTAEHEIRRVNRLLEKLELQASTARLGYGSDPADRLKRLQAEIQLQENRLRDLLGEPDDSAI